MAAFNASKKHPISTCGHSVLQNKSYSKEKSLELVVIADKKLNELDNGAEVAPSLEAEADFAKRSQIEMKLRQKS